MNNAAYKVREQDQQQKQQKTVRQVVRKTKRKITVGEKLCILGLSHSCCLGLCKSFQINLRFIASVKKCNH